jgi:hypothetical protein
MQTAALMALLDNSADPAVRLDAEAKYTAMNRAAVPLIYLMKPPGMPYLNRNPPR